MSQVRLSGSSEEQIVCGENGHHLNEVYPFSLTYHFQPNNSMMGFPKVMVMPISSHFPSESIAAINLVMKLF